MRWSGQLSVRARRAARTGLYGAPSRRGEGGSTPSVDGNLSVPMLFRHQSLCRLP
jgi:hypothetical protein